MWYAVETVFIDGKHFASRLCFDPKQPGYAGTCRCRHDEEPMNSCERRFGDRIELHTDWFETPELAEKFKNGAITYEHIYHDHYRKDIRSSIPHFVKRVILDVDEKRAKPWHGIYTHIRDE